MRTFKKFYIEITNVCNLACDFCPQTRRKPAFMEIETFTKIIEQMKAHTDYIYLHVKGEPFLHPHLDQVLEISHKNGLKVTITTNGTLIHQVKEMLLAKPALRQINFSLHSFDGNEGAQNKTEYIHRILDFAAEAVVRSEMRISLRLWNLEENNADPINQNKNNEILQSIEEVFDLPYKIQEKVVPGKGIQISDRIYLNQEHQFQWPDLRVKEDDGKGFCYGLRNQIAILVDGTVVPCCLDGEGVMNLGNIHANTFSEIIESERACAIIEGFSRREAVEELCKKCGYRKRFGK